MAVRILAAIVVYLAAAAAPGWAQGPGDPPLTSSTGEAVGWLQWLEGHGATTVLLWASWTPEGEAVLADSARMQSIAGGRGLGFVVVALQEPIETSRAALETRDLPWLHDRHGALLKTLRVYAIPTIVVVAADGTVLARLEPSARALEAWPGP
jgi:hypothetical protein